MVNAVSWEYQLTYLTILPGSIGTADGSALVRMGGMTVVCGVKAKIAEPDLEKPDKGFLGMTGCSLFLVLIELGLRFSAKCWSSSNMPSAIQTWLTFRPSTSIIRAVIWDPNVICLPCSRKSVDAWYTVSSFLYIQSKNDSSTNTCYTFWKGSVDALCECNMHKLWWKHVWCKTNYDGFCSFQWWAAIIYFFQSWLVVGCFQSGYRRRYMMRNQDKRYAIVNPKPHWQLVVYCFPCRSVSSTRMLRSFVYPSILSEKFWWDRTHILADPTAFEEPLLDSTVTIVTGEDSTSEVEYGLGIVNPSSKWTSSSGAVADDPLSACIKAAKTRRYDLARIVKEAIGFEEGRKDWISENWNVRFFGLKPSPPTQSLISIPERTQWQMLYRQR